MKSSVSHFQAIGFALAGFWVWVLDDTCIKLVRESALPPYEIVALFSLFGAMIMVLKVSVRGKTKELWPKRPVPQLGRALVCLGNNFCNVIALKHLPLTMFYIVAFTSPLVIAVLAAAFLKEKLTWQKLLAILAGFSGVVIAVHPGAADMAGDWIGYTAMVGAVAGCAVNVVWLRVMTQSETPDSLTFFTAFVGTVAGFVLMIFHAEPVTFGVLALLVLVGLFNVVGCVFNYIALKHVAAATVFQFHYTQLIIGAIIGYAIWNEMPTMHLLAGAVIITLSGLYIAAHVRKTEQLARVLVEKP